MSSYYSIKNSNCKSISKNYPKKLKGNEERIDSKELPKWPKWKFPKKRQLLNPKETIYCFKSFDISNQKEISFEKYIGQVLLIVNVASFCNFTFQYPKLNELEAKYRQRGFRVLGFPCNQFGHVRFDF
jgi:hypothetical protein